MTRVLDKQSTRRRKVKDPSNPADAAYLRAMHPDFDELMGAADVDYRTMAHTDVKFADKFRIPPLVEPSRTFQEHSNSVDAVCWGPEVGQFVSASHDRTLKVWEARSGKCLKTLTGHSAGIYHCAVSTTKRHLLSCGSGEGDNLLLWEMPQGRVAAKLSGHSKAVHHVRFSADGRQATSVDQEGSIVLNDLSTAKPILQRSVHFGVVHCSAYCLEDPQLLCTAGHDGQIHLTDLREAGKQPFWSSSSMAANCARPAACLSIPSPHDGFAVYGVEFPDARNLISCGADQKAKRWDLRMSPWRPSNYGEFLGHSTGIRAITLSPDRRFLVTGCEDGSCRVWPKDGRSQRTPASPAGHVPALRTLSGHVGLVSGCAWQEDEAGRVASVLSSSWDQKVQLFEIPLSELTTSK